MTVILFPKPKITDASDSTAMDSLEKAEAPPVHTSTADERSTGRQVETNQLYPVSHELRPELARSFTLLSEGLEYVSQSIKALKEGDLISSDDFIHRLQALLPELFCCRSIGDGFGAIINAIYQSLANMQGSALELAQLETIRRGLRRISTEPFLELSEAVDEIIRLQDIGLEPEPNYFKYAAELLDE